MLVHPRKSLDHQIMKSTLHHEGNTCMHEILFAIMRPHLLAEN